MQHDQSKGAPPGAQQSFAEAELENLLKNREYLHLNLPSVLDNSKFREPLEFHEDKDKREKVFDKFYTGRIQIKGLEDRDCPLDVDILIPKSIVDVKDERTHPVHVKFHGGGFCTGAPLFKPWFPYYIRDLCLDMEAVTLLPHYRKMPESTGFQISWDASYFWWWFRNVDMFEKDLEQVFEKLNVPNFNVRERIQKQKLLVSGESAGGFLAVHALIASRGDPPADISALYLQYPMLGHYTRKSLGKYRDIDIDEKELQKFADDRMKKIEYLRNDGRLQTRFASNPPEGMDMAYMLSSTKAPDGNGSYWKYWFGGDDMLEETQKLIVDNPEESQKWGCPRIFITHGKDDVNCPSTDSEKFIEMIEKVYPGKSTLVLLDGKAHAFDYSCEVGDVEHEDWLPDLVNMMKMAWDPDFCPGKSVKKLQDIEGKQTIKGLRE